MNSKRTAVLVFVLAIVFFSRAGATIHDVTAGPGLLFFPPEIFIAHGDTVRWEVVEGIHTTTSSPGSSKLWDSGNMGVSGTFDVIFTAPDGPGPFPYRCELHWLSGMLGTVFIDNDGDGWSADVDCDDTDPSINPGASEVCNSIDDDCDTQIDEGFTTTWYEDADGDGYGDSQTSQTVCSQPNGYVDNDLDCDDTNAQISPDGTEVCNSIDDDCDTQIDEGFTTTWYADTDGDGYGDIGVSVISCSQPPGFVDNDLDCNDTDAQISPDGTEVCNNVDDDCDGTPDDGVEPATWYEDADGDGYGESQTSQVACSQPNGYVDNDLDCDDTDVQISPDATEVCNGIDDNCDAVIDEGFSPTTWYEDSDGDLFGNSAVSQVACSQPSGYVDNDLDCNDTDAEIGLCLTCCTVTRGNANDDPEDKANVADVSYLVAWLFGIPSGPAPVCIEEANANGDVEEKANVADVSYLVAWLFGIPSGPAPVACP